MWLVYDYVVDVLQIREASGSKLPGLIYVRTQETEVQQREYSKEFKDFGSFFDRVLEEHEDAHVLTQMFAPGRIAGHALPVWTVNDLDSYESGGFWQDGHQSPFKDAVANLCEKLATEKPPLKDAAEESVGPPLMALSALSAHLSKIARLEKFDPRDHEATKVVKLRAALRSIGFDAEREPLWLADLFDPEDDDVKQHCFQLEAVAKGRIEKICEDLRIDVEIVEADPDVAAVLLQFKKAAKIFDAAMEAFAGEDFSEKKILLKAICNLHLDAPSLADELWRSFADAEEQFLTMTGLPRSSFKDLRLHQRVKWRIEDAISSMRGRSASEIRLRKPDTKEFELANVWSIGEWPGLDPKRRRSKVHRPEYALWTDGTSWKLYEEKFLNQKGDGFIIGELRDEGRLKQEGCLPVPASPSSTQYAARSMQHDEDSISGSSPGGHFV
jgi:hypothetical protein